MVRARSAAAERRFALLLAVRRGEAQSILYDAGLAATPRHNVDVLDRPTDLRAIVLSHGHPDHHTGLDGLFRRLGRPGVPSCCTDAWRITASCSPPEPERHAPTSRADLAAEGVDVVEDASPSLLLDRTVLVSSHTKR